MVERVRLSQDPVVAVYKQHVDRTLLRENLRRTVAERLANLVALQAAAQALRDAGSRQRRPFDE